MRIQYVSDIHLDIRSSFNLETLGDILILAGDIGQPGKANYKEFLQELGAYQHVFLISGNHEYYSSGKRKHEIDYDLYKLCKALPNVTYLHMAHAELWPGGPLILGTTLWSRIQNKAAAQAVMSDYVRIRTGPAGQKKQKITPDQTNEWHRQELAWLAGKLAQVRTETPEKPIIVVTHHAPLLAATEAYATLHPKEGRHCDDAFATDLEELIKQQKPDFWIHGHTHCLVDLRVGETHVLCCPVGYPSETGLSTSGGTFDI